MPRRFSRQLPVNPDPSQRRKHIASSKSSKTDSKISGGSVDRVTPVDVGRPSYSTHNICASDLGSLRSSRKLCLRMSVHLLPRARAARPAECASGEEWRLVGDIMANLQEVELAHDCRSGDFEAQHVRSLGGLGTKEPFNIQSERLLNAQPSFSVLTIAIFSMQPVRQPNALSTLKLFQSHNHSRPCVWLDSWMTRLGATG